MRFTNRQIHLGGFKKGFFKYYNKNFHSCQVDDSKHPAGSRIYRDSWVPDPKVQTTMKKLHIGIGWGSSAHHLRRRAVELLII